MRPQKSHYYRQVTRYGYDSDLKYITYYYTMNYIDNIIKNLMDLLQ